MATGDLTVALRIQAFLDDARKNVQALKGDLSALQKAGADAGKALGKTGADAGKALGQPGPVAAAKTPAGGSGGAAGANTKPQPIQAATGAIAAQTDAIKKNTSAARENAGATESVGAAAGRATARVRQARAEVNQYGISAGQTTAALRQLPAQFTDIFTSLAGGQNPLLVLIQQGGQIKDSFGGTMPALRALTSIITPLRVLVGGLAAALVAAGTAAYKGSLEHQEYTKALVLSGNAAGTTADRLADAAGRIDDVVGTQGKAAAALAEMAASGRVAGENLEHFATVAIELERSAGKPIADTAKELAELGKEPVKASLKLNEAYRYLTPEIIRQLRALEEQGRAEEAAALAQKTYASAMRERALQIKESQGFIQRGWQAITDVAAKAWDAMLGIGRPVTNTQQLAILEEQLQRLNERNANLGIKPGKATADLKAQIEAKKAEIAATDGQAKAQSVAARETDEYNKAVDRTIKLTQTKNEELAIALKTYRDDVALRRRKGDVISESSAKAGEQEIRDRILGKGTKPNTAFTEASAEAAIALARLKADMAVLQAAINANDAIVLQALKDGTTSIDQAYLTRLASIEQENAAQRQTLLAEIAETEKALGKAKTAAERAPLTQKKIELQAQVKVLETSLSEASRTLLVWKTEQERELATITARIRVDAAAIRGGFDKRAVEDQLRLQLEPETKRIGSIADPAERAAAEERLQLIFRAGVAQAEFNAKLAESQRIQEALAVQEGAVQAQLQRGLISQVEAEAKLLNLRAQQVPVLLEIAGQLDAIRAALPAEAAAILDQMAAAIARLRNETTAATPVIVSAGTRIRNTMIDGIADAAATAVTNFKSLREVVAGTLRQIAGDIIRSKIKKILTDQFTPDSSGGGGGGSGGLIQAGIKFVRNIFGFSDGGLIRGPGTGTSDSIPALVDGRQPIAVSNEEFIQPQRAVKHYGVRFMEAVRTLQLPRPAFAFGGLVQAHRQARFATGGPTSNALAGGGMSVKVELVNNGTPQRVKQTSQSFDGKDAVVRLFLDDIRNGGPMSSAMQSVMDRR